MTPRESCWERAISVPRSMRMVGTTSGRICKQNVALPWKAPASALPHRLAPTQPEPAQGTAWNSLGGRACTAWWWGRPLKGQAQWQDTWTRRAVGLLGLEKHFQAFFCRKRKNEKIQGARFWLRSWYSPGPRWSGCCCPCALKAELQTSAGFFLAGRKGKFPPVTDKNNGFGASLGLQRL